jgi:putative ABC transport system permease protein
MQTLIQDLRYGARMLLKRPGFTIVALITLALGIGANTAIFSLVNTVLLKSLPWREPERLVMINEKKEGNYFTSVSYDDFRDFRAESKTFEQMAAISPQWTLTLTGLAEAQQFRGQYVSANLFSMLGVAPAPGRAFRAEDDQPNSERTVIISHGFWQRRAGGDPNFIGKTIALDGQAYTVIGVMPAGFRILDEAEFWLPLSFNMITTRGRSVRAFAVIGQLRPGATIAQAQAEMSSITASLEQQYPDSNRGFRAELVPLHEHITGKARTLLLVLPGAGGLVLLIACANVANLLLARATARRREMAIRAALGAGRWQIVRQLLTESVLLFMIGGAAGLLLTTWGLEVLLKLSPADIPRRDEISIDATVLWFTLGLSLLTGLVFGLVPAWQASRADLHDALKESSHSAGAASGAKRFRNALVVAEMAFAIVLLIASGLLIRSFVRLLDVKPGFATENIIGFGVSLPNASYADAQRRAEFYQRLEERLRALPGVVAVGAATRLPLLDAARNITSFLTIEGRPETERDRPEVDFRRATPGYFQTMGIPQLQGRLFTEQDLRAQNSVVVINEVMARKYWPNEDPVGKRIGMGGGAPGGSWSTIIGVVGSVRHLGLDSEPRPEVYYHYLTSPPVGPVIVIRTAAAPDALMNSIRSEVAALDKDAPVSQISTMEQVVARSVAPQRFMMLLFGLFAIVALVLAAVGIYGVMAYSVAQRTQEIGIRMALGAEKSDVLKLVIGQGMKLTALGVAPGLLAAFGLTRLMAGLLFGVSATDPLTFVVIALLLALVALLACYLPARRATRIDPLIALRCE